VAAVLVLVAAGGAAVPWMLGDDETEPPASPPARAMAPVPPAPLVPVPPTTPQPTSPSPTTPSATPSTSGEATPSRTAPARPAGAGTPQRPRQTPRTTKAAPAARRTTAPPKPYLVVSTSGSHCTGWDAGHGWTIHVAVTVHNGRGRSATGTHGYDRNVGGTGTYRLSGGARTSPASCLPTWATIPS
jgi:hypothetical protein